MTPLPQPVQLTSAVQRVVPSMMVITDGAGLLHIDVSQRGELTSGPVCLEGVGRTSGVGKALSKRGVPWGSYV